ncbi:hypothetical protein [Parachryseolinea silvisoli]|uniref:hypothetical protein n=1 Tax=Parachryseolinea silvisoli TaxID=2873601 RepID=UPI002265BA30|nr:hypothetical protein [Parachryseolinea silvisoli]MCD9015628.1 hypothetical protein [Parachryseolinea silvisoli]
MKKLSIFITELSPEEVLTVLRNHTFPTAGEFLILPFGSHYFSGMVSEKRIHVRNALRFGRGEISPILHISVQPLDDRTEITIYDDTEDEIRTSYLIYLTLSLCMSVTILLVGVIGYIAKPEEFSLFWTIAISLLVSLPAFFFKVLTRVQIDRKSESDVAYLFSVLKR